MILDDGLFYLLAYLGPSLPMDRPSTTFRQRKLFWAILAASVQLKPGCSAQPQCLASGY